MVLRHCLALEVRVLYAASPARKRGNSTIDSIHMDNDKLMVNRTLTGVLSLSRAAVEINRAGAYECFLSLTPGYVSVGLSEIRDEGRLTKLNRMVELDDEQACRNLSVELREMADVPQVDGADDLLMVVAPEDAPQRSSTRRHRREGERDLKNLTRYTYETTAFQGWRLCVCRKGNQFTKYFSDRQYGSEKASLKAAVKMRDKILAQLGKGADPRTVFEMFQQQEGVVA